jgi:CRP-like cAMP-binding protein
MQQRQRVAQLSKVPLFADCSKRELGRLLSETPIEWLVLDRASLRTAIDEVPGLGWHLLQSVAARLDQASRRSSSRHDYV